MCSDGRLKVIFFNPYVKGSGNGAARRAEFLSGLLTSRGIECEVILAEEYAADPKNFGEALALKLGIPRLAYFLKVWALCRLPGSLVVSEVIFSPTWHRQFVLTVHDLKAFQEKASRGGQLRRMAYFLFSRLARKILVVSESVRSDLVVKCGVAASRIHLVPNGISLQRLKLAREYSEVKKRYDFIYVSSFAQHKRQDLLVYCAPTGSRICLIGRNLGALKDVRRAIRSRKDQVEVDVYENIDTDEDLFKHMGSARCGVFPSIFEGFGIPILEYAATGLKIVAADIEPFRELSEYVDHLVPPDDFQAWRTVLDDVFQAKWDSSPSAIAKVASGRFTDESIAKQLHELIINWSAEK